MVELLISSPDAALHDESKGSITSSSKPLSESHWRLQYQPDGLTLAGLLENQLFKVRFDFEDAELQYRLKHGGRTKEPLAKAIGIKGATKLSVIDATAGMGRESYFLVSLGCQVTSLERQPIIYWLLKDAVERLQKSQENPLIQQWEVLHQDSISFLASQNRCSTDVVYLDPMFPQRNKSAAVKKEMRIFKRLSGEDLDANELLDQSLRIASKRVVVKRPKKAPTLNQVRPSLVIDANNYRFDVYLTTN